MTQRHDPLRAQLQRSLAPTFMLERDLGGRSSRAFLAREVRRGRTMVIKALRPEVAATLNAEHFTRELRLSGALEESHIVPIVAAGHTAGIPWYAMPYIPGESLRTRLSRGPLGVRETTRILRHVAQALAHAHDTGVVHRDLKPEKIRYSSGTALVTDFGVATARAAAVTQPAGDATVGHGADLHAWGGLAYELLAGTHPHDHQATAMRLVPTRELAPSLVSLVMRCLATEPDDRPSSAHELLATLHQLPSAGPASPRALDVPLPMLIGGAALMVLAAAAMMR